MKTKVLEESALTMAEVKQVLEEAKKKEGELNFRAAKTLDYLGNVPLLDAKLAKKLKEELEAMNLPRIKDSHIAKLIDLTPINAEDVRMILQSYTLSLSQENRQKIADAFEKIKG